MALFILYWKVWQKCTNDKYIISEISSMKQFSFIVLNYKALAGKYNISLKLKESFALAFLKFSKITKIPFSLKNQFFTTVKKNKED